MKCILIVICLLVLSYIISCGQSGNDGTIQTVDSSAELILTDSLIEENARLSPMDFFIKGYSDSINNIRSVNNIPVFIGNPQFDYENAGIWSPSHHPLSLRFMIMDKVTDCDALKILLQSNNQAYKLKPIKKYNIDIDYIKLSFHELALNRYKQLKCQP